VELGRRGRQRRLAVEDEYLKLILEGVGTVEACRRVGIGRKTGYRWRAERGGLPPLWLGEADRKGRYLSRLERQRIATLRGRGPGVRELGGVERYLGRHGRAVAGVDDPFVGLDHALDDPVRLRIDSGQGVVHVGDNQRGGGGGDREADRGGRLLHQPRETADRCPVMWPRRAREFDLQRHHEGVNLPKPGLGLVPTRDSPSASTMASRYPSSHRTSPISFSAANSQRSFVWSLATTGDATAL
jgi:hypothetical protein